MNRLSTHKVSFRWDEVRRAHLRAELDAYYARLYGPTGGTALYLGLESIIDHGK